jgi:DNA-binding transcriptional ArsR family regulator
MVEHDSQTLNGIFHALSDRTRRDMLGKLATTDLTVGELAEPFAMSLAAASKHIRVLEKAGLVRRDIQGRTHRCSLAPMPLASADQWLDMYRRYWTEQLGTLEELLRSEDEPSKPMQQDNSKKENEDD